MYWSKWKKRMALLLSIVLASSLFTYSGLIDNRVQAAEPWEADFVTIQSGSSFVSVSGTVVNVNGSPANNNERFKVERIVSGSNTFYQFKSAVNNNYLSYNGANDSFDGFRLTARSGNPGETERFVMTKNSNGTYSLQTQKDFTYSFNLKRKGKVRVNSSQLQLTTGNAASLTISPVIVSQRPGGVRILEITDTGVSDLASIFGSNSPLVNIDTFSMKAFVASRHQLDGVYDAVYIGKGSYKIDTPSKLTSANTSTKENAHITSGLQNDITKLKADEITNSFIEMGLPVILHTDIKSQANWNNKQGILKSSFAKYDQAGQTRPNVVFVNNNDIANSTSFLNKTKLLDNGNKRPLLTLSQQPVDYLNNNNHVYEPQNANKNKISFSYTIGNIEGLQNKNVYLNLYIGVDVAVPFQVEQLVAAEEIKTNSGSFTYTLPRAYSGLQYWKLELVDYNSGLKDVKTGVYRVKDKKIDIKILQIMPNNNNNSDLTKSTGIKPAYLRDANENYDIQIDVTNITEFNNGKHRNLNGNYDMLLFGFTDSYNVHASINAAASDSVLAFINTGQSVMFSHDTVFKGDGSDPNSFKFWIDKFQSASGQIEPQTDMGLSAPNTTERARKVNDGLLTQYPHNLPNDVINIATTHNQYFTLDLEDPNVVPWYNLDGGSAKTRTIGDSWNHYYTYSKGNVTYTGSGHTNVNFPDDEQKVFVNTMYRAYIGSNHAPEITVYSPLKDSTHPTYSDILVSYRVDDFDLNDRDIITSVNFKHGNTTIPVIKDLEVLTGTTVNQLVPNPLPNCANECALTMEIIAKDKNGAAAQIIVPIKVVKAESDYILSRTPSSNIFQNMLPINEAGTFTYTIEAKDIPRNRISGDATKITLSGMTFSEKFPPQLEISGLPSGFTRTGSLSGGYTVTGTIPNFEYTRSGNNPFKPTKRTHVFTIKATPKVTDTVFPLMDGKINFKELGTNKQLTQKFPDYVLNSITKITSLKLNNRTVLVGDRIQMLPIFTPENPSVPHLDWTSSDSTAATISSGGVVEGLQAGKTTITAATKDGSGLTASAEITVVQPGLSIEGPDKLGIGQNIVLTEKLLTADYEQIESYQWSITSGSGLIAFVGSTNSKSATIKGNNSGSAVVTLKVTTNMNRSYTATKRIDVGVPVSSLGLTGTALRFGETKKLSLTVAPSNATNKNVTWESSKPDVVTVDQSGNVRGVGIGESTIKITSMDGTNISRTAVVSVSPVISGPTEVELGASISLNGSYSIAPSTPLASSGGATWTVTNGTGNAQATSSGSNAQLKGLKAGTVTVQLTLRTADGKTYTSNSIQVVVKPVTLFLSQSRTIEVGENVSLFNLLVSNPVAGKTNIQQQLSWSSSNSAMVSVNSSTGVITGVRAGSATITVTYAHDPSVKAQILIIVRSNNGGSTNPGGGPGGKY